LSSYIPIHTIKGVFREVSRGKAKFGVVPIENSFNGIVSDTISCLSDYNLKIIAEVIVEIHHVLATKAEDINTTYTATVGAIALNDKPKVHFVPGFMNASGKLNTASLDPIEEVISLSTERLTLKRFFMKFETLSLKTSLPI
jgi:hypothetical protein